VNPDGAGPSGPVFVAAGVIEAIIRHAQREAPRECCGLLVGNEFRIDESVPTTNIASDPSLFLIDPAEHIDLNRRLRGTLRSVAGAYHSHPNGPPAPSRRDVAEAHYPEFLYLIVSLVGDPLMPVCAYRIRDREAVEVILVDEGRMS
jgi:proteasome lid subunit RPN8/RPN11